ncbi:MAG: hypothetical protein AB7F89_24335 [Pirellulaceae bacterium]
MRWKWLINLLFLTALLAGGSMDHARPTVAAQESAGGEALRAKWRVGDTWIVETQTRPLQARAADGPAKVRWRLQVQSLEANLENGLSVATSLPNGFAKSLGPRPLDFFNGGFVGRSASASRPPCWRPRARRRFPLHGGSVAVRP